MTSSNCFQRSANQDAFCVFLHCGNLFVLSVAMADISWAALLQPLEASAAATAVLVLQLVPIPLAGAVLRSLAWAWQKQSLAPNSSENVVWKVARYLPPLSKTCRKIARRSLWCESPAPDPNVLAATIFRRKPQLPKPPLQTMRRRLGGLVAIATRYTL